MTEAQRAEWAVDESEGASGPPPKQPWGWYVAGCAFALAWTIVLLVVVLRGLADVTIGGH